MPVLSTHCFWPDWNVQPLAATSRWNKIFFHKASAGSEVALHHRPRRKSEHPIPSHTHNQSFCTVFAPKRPLPFCSKNRFFKSRFFIGIFEISTPPPTKNINPPLARGGGNGSPDSHGDTDGHQKQRYNHIDNTYKMKYIARLTNKLRQVTTDTEFK